MLHIMRLSGNVPVVESGAAVEAAEAVDDTRRRVRPDADGAAVRRNGKDVRRAAERRHGHPARVGREGHVLHLGRRVAPMQLPNTKQQSTFQRVRVIPFATPLKKK